MCLNSVLNVKALVGAFNQEKALIGAFSVIVKTDCKTDGSFYSTSLNPLAPFQLSGLDALETLLDSRLGAWLR